MAENAQLDAARPQPGSGPSASYGQILKSSSIVGGAQVITLAIGMVRTKIIAILLGPSGVGLVALFQSSTSLVGAVASMGIAKSAVRQVAESQGCQDDVKIARTIKCLRRVCWLTGLLAWGLTAALAYPLSQWTFDNGTRTGTIALLGATLFLGSISTGQSALLQGLRRIEDLARLQIVSAILSTALSVGLYAWLGQGGIIPVLLATAALNLGLSWLIARRIHVAPVELSWADTAREGHRFISLGLAFMWTGMLGAAVTLATQSLISRKLGVDSNGIYQAAWALSGVFAGFILNAMGTDFYPRLASVARDNEQVNRLVNEQTEVGVLLALPGLLATLVFSPWVIRLFYTTKFAPAAELLPWFVLGICARVICWPIGYILLAKGASRTFAVTETVFSLLQITLIYVGLHWVGLEGVAMAFAFMYFCYTIAIYRVAHRLSGFRWSTPTLRLLTGMGGLVAVVWSVARLLPVTSGTIVSAALVWASGIYSIRQILARLGPAHRVSKKFSSLPIMGRLLNCNE